MNCGKTKKCVVCKMLFLFICFLVFNFYIVSASSDADTKFLEAENIIDQESVVEEDSLEVAEESNMWEQAAAIAALSWGMDYKAFRIEAEEFLKAYKKNHPSSRYPASVEDLIILPKPNMETLRKKFTEFNEAHENKYTDEIHGLTFGEHEGFSMFLVPSHQ